MELLICPRTSWRFGAARRIVFQYRCDRLVVTGLDLCNRDSSLKTKNCPTEALSVSITNSTTLLTAAITSQFIYAGSYPIRVLLGCQLDSGLFVCTGTKYATEIITGGSNATILVALDVWATKMRGDFRRSFRRAPTSHTL